VAILNPKHRTIPVSRLSLIILLVVAVISFFANIAFSYVVLVDGNGHELSWFDYRLPVRYAINFQGTPDTSGEFAAIQSSFQTWEDVLSAQIPFQYEGKTADKAGFDSSIGRLRPELVQALSH
jgi:hypothetical protein